MSGWQRSALGLIAGIAVGFGAVAALENIGHLMFDLPKVSANPTLAERAAYMDGVGLVPKLWLLLVWFAAPLAGGWVAARISKARWSAGIVAALILAPLVFVFTQYAHPAWMIAACVILISLAPALANRLTLGR